MIKVFAGAENIISSLGFNAEENIDNIIKGNTGIKIDESGVFSPLPLPLSLVDHNQLKKLCEIKETEKFTPLERMFIFSITDSIRKSNITISSPDTLIIITSTKGNIDLLDPEKQYGISMNRVYLSELSKKIAEYFNNPNTPLIISNACISGLVGIIYGERMIQSGKYKNVVVAGGDIMSEFVVSGFQSFQSLSMQPCKPFDEQRDGLSLGEGCGTIILSASQDVFKEDNRILVLGGAGSNDANHISGPSRSGDGLQIAIKHALEFSGISPNDIHSISAHGTATDYNDEMEAKAFSSAGLESVPTNSYKGYIGHTLGAAGVIEAAISLQSMKKNMLFRSAGYSKHGLSKKINIISKTEKSEVNTCLKTASGFGGSNAAVIFQKQY